MKPNKVLLDAIKKAHLDETIGWLFCCAIFLKGKEGLAPLWDVGWINEETEYLYRCALINVDPETKRWAPRYPLMDLQNKDSYNEYITKLGQQPIFKKGIAYTRLEKNKEGSMAFNYILQSVPEFDINRLVDATIQYYKDAGEYSVKLTSFLQNKAIAL